MYIEELLENVCKLHYTSSNFNLSTRRRATAATSPTSMSRVEPNTPLASYEDVLRNGSRYFLEERELVPL
jgi:hypothetical protein